jgi:hypothetical protein
MCTESQPPPRVPLDQAALGAVQNHPDSHIEMALDFCSKICPSFMAQDNDRLVKVGRSLENMVFLSSHNKIELLESLEQLVEECELLCSGQVKVPKVRFGKTEIQIPILTLGCMSMLCLFTRC